MRILAIDTSSDAATAAIVEDGVLTGEYVLNHKKTHSQKIMVMLERLFGDLELAVEDIDLFAAATGPGSFTGLRIGVATIKALAHSVNKPVVSVSTLSGLAYNLPYCADLIVPIMDARRDNVFNAAYEWKNGALKEAVAPNACHIDECIDRICGKRVVFVGDGVNVYAAHIADRMGENAEFAPVSLRMSKASSVAACALDRAKEGRTEHYSAMKPEYLRLSQAERELQERRKSQ